LGFSSNKKDAVSLSLEIRKCPPRLLLQSQRDVVLRIYEVEKIVSVPLGVSSLLLFLLSFVWFYFFFLKYRIPFLVEQVRVVSLAKTRNIYGSNSIARLMQAFQYTHSSLAVFLLFPDSRGANTTNNCAENVVVARRMKVLIYAQDKSSRFFFDCVQAYFANL
jgi:hypothetical protein